MRIILTLILFNSEFIGVRDKHQVTESPCESRIFMHGFVAELGRRLSNLGIHIGTQIMEFATP